MLRRKSFGVQPGEDTLHGHHPPGVQDPDVAAFEAEVPDDPLSLDGKTLQAKRYPGSIWCRPTLRAGAVLAQVAAPGKGEELAAVKEVLGQVPLKGRVVVADALLRKVCEQIVAGTEYLRQLKTQPTLRRDLEVASPARNCEGWWANRTSLAAAKWRARGAKLTWADAPVKRRHGRLERRELWALADPELNGYVGRLGRSAPARGVSARAPAGREGQETGGCELCN